MSWVLLVCFFFNDTATTEIYTLSLHDALPIYQTIIEDGAFIGSDTQLIAPITVGKNATIGAGSTITQDAPSEKLTLSRKKQKTIDNWKRKKKQ